MSHRKAQQITIPFIEGGPIRAIRHLEEDFIAYARKEYHLVGVVYGQAFQTASLWLQSMRNQDMLAWVSVVVLRSSSN